MPALGRHTDRPFAIGVFLLWLIYQNNVKMPGCRDVGLKTIIRRWFDDDIYQVVIVLDAIGLFLFAPDIVYSFHVAASADLSLAIRVSLPNREDNHACKFFLHTS